MRVAHRAARLYVLVPPFSEALGSGADVWTVATVDGAGRGRGLVN